MPRKAKKTMTELLKQALSEVDSLRGVERATGVKNPSLVRFLQGKQSLRLDLADKLSEHLGIECRQMRRKGK
jgi:plasmid maintenance system antidote protein VapI